MSEFYYRGINDETDPFENASTGEQDDLVMLVTMALFSDARASDDATPPDGTENRRGWWADTYEQDDWSTGSRLWLLDRAPLTQEGVNGAEDYAAQALEFLVTEGIAASVDVSASLNERSRVDLAIEIKQRDGETWAVKYEDLWQAVRTA